MDNRLIPLMFAVSCVLAVAPAQAARFVSLYSFAHPDGGQALADADAGNPYAGLARDAAGNLYGTSYGGGTAGAGAVFMLSPPDALRPGWTETLIHSFSVPAAQDGAHPLGAVIVGDAGVLYGTTSMGGGPANHGGGTVFALRPPAAPGGVWAETVLTVFPTRNGVGATPAARLLQDQSGALYGTTSTGGDGQGSAFKLTPPVSAQGAWTRTDLHVFGDDSAVPISGLTQGAEGALYGTTQYSGGRLGSGTVYQLMPSSHGWTEQTVFTFPAGGAYGASPAGDLLADKDGALFGTATMGGTHAAGTVFRLSPPSAGRRDWSCALLYNFTERVGDGGPQGGLAWGAGGTLIGTTANAARHQQGAVFQLIPGMDRAQSWSETVLARFPTKPSGGGLFPVGDLVGDGLGSYFGVTETGGAGGRGTVFQVQP